MQPLPKPTPAAPPPGTPAGNPEAHPGHPLAFLDVRNQSTYGAAIRASMTEFPPHAVDLLMLTLWRDPHGRFRPATAAWRAWAAERIEQHGYPAVVAAIVITADKAPTPSVAFADGVMRRFRLRRPRVVADVPADEPPVDNARQVPTPGGGLRPVKLHGTALDGSPVQAPAGGPAPAYEPPPRHEPPPAPASERTVREPGKAAVDLAQLFSEMDQNHAALTEQQQATRATRRPDRTRP